MKIKCAVHYSSGVKSVTFDSKLNLMNGLRKSKIPVPFSCGGEGICTTCRLFILDGEVSKPNKLESERAAERGYSINERLSCQCYALTENISVRLP